MKNHVVVPVDKDGNTVIMSLSTYRHGLMQHMQSRKGGAPIYEQICASMDRDSWSSRAQKMQDTIVIVVKARVSAELTPALKSFFDTLKTPRLPVFSLLCTTPKSSKLATNGEWSSRPIVGMPRWATTPVSTLLSTLGQIWLKLDKNSNPRLFTPLLNTMELCDRIHHWVSKQPPSVHHSLCVSTFDFASLYTNITWENLLLTWEWWKKWYSRLSEDALKQISAEERMLVAAFFSEMNRNELAELQKVFCFMHLSSDDCTDLGLVLLNIVYTHVYFECPCARVYRQCIGLAMGTNMAPIWATLVLRMCEHNAELNKNICLSRFIDDGVILHRIEQFGALKIRLSAIYPQNLKFTFEVVSQQRYIPFMDFLIISLAPVQTSVYWKKTHSCSYIPWGSNTPRHVRTGWPRGESIRYLRLCSHQVFYTMCIQRLQGAIRRLGYPQQVVSEFPLPWESKPKFAQLRAQNHKLDDEVGGLGPKKVHIRRVPFHCSVNLAWSKVVHRLQNKLHFVHNTKLFTVLIPSPNLGKYFSTQTRKAAAERTHIVESQ